MNHNILALLLTAIAGSAHAAADAFSDSILAKAEGVPLAYIGKDTRAATARALCMDCEVLLFDEPTSALDPEMIKEVLDVMIELAENSRITMLVVTHEMGFARTVADRIVFMDKGEILETAPPEEFFTNARHPRAQEFLSQILLQTG